MDTSTLIYYRQPARAWTEAMPLGNGRIGAMAWFGTENDKLDLNEDTLWSGGPNRNHTAVDPVGAVKRAREALAGGEYEKAQMTIQNDFTSDDTQTYLPLGSMEIHFDGHETVDGYVRSLDMENGVAACEYRAGGVSFTRNVFVSKPDQVLVYRVSVDRPGGLSCTVALKTPLKAESGAQDALLTLDGECPWQTNRRSCSDTIYFDEDAKRGVGFRAAAEIRAKGGSVQTQNGVCSIENADGMEIRFCARTSFAGSLKHPYLEGKEYKNACLDDLARIRKTDYDALLSAHEADFSALMNRVHFALDKENAKDMPTDERLMAYQQDKNDPVLYELIYNFGRYLMVSASRPGTRPMNLQGIWNNSVTPPWRSNYTININTEMNYWPAEPCALGEMTLPLMEMVENLRVTGEDTAKTFYGVRGSVSHHNTDLWASSNPVGERCDGSAVWGFWQMSFGWLCRHMFDRYLFTLDKEFLRLRALPCLKAAARFYLDILEDVDGELAISPSTSPENMYRVGKGKYSVARATAMTDAIVREVFEEVLAGCEALKDTDEITDEIRSVMPRLRTFKVGGKGQMLEWDSEFEENEPHHRHTSHLYALYPGHDITPAATPELADACRTTLNLRGDDGTGWSLGWKINFWARLNDGNHALKLLKNQLRFVSSSAETNYSGGGGTYLNLFDAHPPFQIDGNFGTSAGITEMLMRTEPACLTILPALPDEWPTGEVSGLCAMNDWRVNICFANGKLVKAEIEARQDPPVPVNVAYGGKTLLCIDRAGSYTVREGA